MTTPHASEQLTGRLAAYAAGLRTSGAIRTDAIEAAFAAVPRHRFLPRFRYQADEYHLDPATIPDKRVLDLIYANNALLTHTGQDGNPPSSSSSPSIMAKMLDALDLAPSLRVLEIGTGTGYNAALIYHITRTDVTTIEVGDQAASEAATAIRSLGLDDQVHVIRGDGYDGDRDHAPYDRVVVTCGIAGIPPAWQDQLASNALIVAPIAHAGVHPILAAHRQPDGDLVGRVLLWGDFMPAAGNLRPAGLFGHDPAVDIAIADARQITDAAPALDQDGYQDLWCYLGAHEPRITRAYPDTDAFDLALGVCALVDPGSGTAWVHRNGTMTLAGDHRLADHLAELCSRWDAAGRPAAGDWLVDWRHADTDGAGLLLPHQWRQAT